MKTIEIVVPCYNEEGCIEPLNDAVKDVFDKIDNYEYSILYVDDGSSDKTLEEIKVRKDKDPDHVNYVTFARNFGKEAAIYAGLFNSTGDYVVLMDADLQHPPTLIPEMIQGMEEGYECCGARRVTRKGEPLFRSIFSRAFYKFINKVTDLSLVQGGSDYRMMSRKMVDAVLLLSERERFTKGILSWVGFETKWIEYENVERITGNSKWSFKSLARYAVSGFVAFSTAPLKMANYFGMFVVLLALIYAIITFVSTLVYGGERTGYATIIILLLFVGGVIITLLGVIGEYLAKIYSELKRRPIYIEKDNTKKKDK